MEITKINFQQHGDERGMLVALEENHEVPFSIKRVYYLYGTVSGVNRGMHAHKSLQQILVCVHGVCQVTLDDGSEKETVLLDKPYEGIYVRNDMWHEMHDFSRDAVLLVLASDWYKEEDYIRNYQEFLTYYKKG